MSSSTAGGSQYDDLVLSDDPQHPANLICELCRNFYTLGWV
jgi:methylthioribulose-1-phosphate dehydratase